MKIISPWFNLENSHILLPQGDYHGYQFSCDANLREYDWLVVYDELTKMHPVEELACSPEHTILVTQEPPSIKLYPPFYTKQFNYILTTHDSDYITHPHWRRGEGCFIWLDGYPFHEHSSYQQPEKTKTLSAVHSAKQMKHTDHYKRYQLLNYLKNELADFDWYGYGMTPLEHKMDALAPYAYHIVIENYAEDFHWSEKIADALMHYCLPFYAGDAHLDQVLPADSFIRIPLDDHAEAARIIREAIDNDEYSKRLPAIRQARQQLLEKNNLYQQIIKTIEEHKSSDTSQEWKTTRTRIQRRHRLRRLPWNAVSALWFQLRCSMIGFTR